MKQSRKAIVKRTLVYSLMSLSVVITVALLMLAVLGYSFNAKDNRLEQGGLLQFSSIPSGATVAVDQVTLGSRTPSKLTTDAAHHSVTMNLQGYRQWSKSIDVKPGMIGWLSYARLIPSEPKTEKVRSFPTLSGALASDDRRWLAVVEDPAQPVVLVANVQNDDVAYEQLILPATSFTAPAEGKTQRFTLHSWTNNGQTMLVTHEYDDGKLEWLTVDRENQAKAKNISARLGLNSPKVEFAANDGRTAFAIVDGSVRRLNLSDETISRPLVADVDDFSVYKETMLLYTTKPDATTKQRTAGYLGDGMELGQPLATYADDGQAIHVASSEYFGERYVATSHGSQVLIRSGDLPKGANKGDLEKVVSYTTPAPITHLSMSTNGRFVIAETGTGYTVHDLELSKTTTTPLKDVVAPARTLRWIDSFMTWYDAGGTLRLYEFDGGNQQNVMTVAEGFDVVISPNNKYLYSIGHDDSGYTIQRVRMILN